MINVKEYIQKSSEVIKRLEEEEGNIIKCVDCCVGALKSGNKIIFCGNGGSAAEAQHFAAELMGRFLIDRRPLASIALTVDTSALTAIGNDYGFENVFSRQLEGVGVTGDVLIGISTSGNSVNVLNAFEVARMKGIKTILLAGNQHSSDTQLVDVRINSTSNETNFIQEGHLVIGHLICALIESQMYA